VAKESGRLKVATFRRACDKRLRDAMTTLADSSRLHDPWAKDIYLRARGRGCDHPHAIRVLGGRGCGWYGGCGKTEPPTILTSTVPGSV
jgi:hypothetical protein